MNNICQKCNSYVESREKTLLVTYRVSQIYGMTSKMKILNRMQFFVRSVHLQNGVTNFYISSRITQFEPRKTSFGMMSVRPSVSGALTKRLKGIELNLVYKNCIPVVRLINIWLKSYKPELLFLITFIRN